MKKRYNESKKNANAFAEHIERRSEEFRITKRRDDDYETIFMKLNSTQQRKRKNLRKKSKRTNKTCYSCDKSDHFAKNCRSRDMMSRRQINATLRKDSENWIIINLKKIVRQIARISKSVSNDDYFHVETREKLFKILNEKESYETSAFTNQINTTIKMSLTLKRHFTSFL